MSPSSNRAGNKLDRLIDSFDTALRTIAGVARSTRPSPATPSRSDADLTPDERRNSGALMRVNHVGEVCAQALYQSQALTARDPALREKYRQAAAEEADHLAWTAQRLKQLGARPSALNPLWYGGAFVLGGLAGLVGDRFSLGFMAETERQVERHLQGHLGRLPVTDAASRAIVEQMRADEALHAAAAENSGGQVLPPPVSSAMKLAARVMTTTAARI
jgi:ubiquinone biosynthesis monooxygenase Coq7